jgi:hypothetical protein
MTTPDGDKSESIVQTDPHSAGNEGHDARGTKARTPHRRRRIQPWVNWTLALLTVPGAGLVFLFGMGAVMSIAGCSDHACRHQGPGEFWFGVLFYGAPVVPVIAIVLSFFTAARDRGILVPLIAWALLAADLAIMAFTFRP